MSSTRNSQNLLVNVFRPTYVFDGCGFTAGVVATNLKTLDVNTVRAGTVAIGDTGNNVYIGNGSGVTYAASLSNSYNTALGVNAAAGLSNVQNSVFIGANAGIANSVSCNTTIIGANANAFGTQNIVIGNGTFVSGSNNIVIGTDVSFSGSYKLQVGNVFTADISSAASLVVSGVARFDNSVGVFRDPSYKLDVSGTLRASDASGSLIFSGGQTYGTSFITANGVAYMGAGLSTNIYPTHRGMYMISAKSISNNTDYLYGYAFLRDASVGSVSPLVQITEGGNLKINHNAAGYIQLSNNGLTDISAAWTVQYQYL